MAVDMTRKDKQRKRLIGLLEQLFQLDQPDLDFGFYKIMHAKSQTVSNFLQKDLLQIIEDAFGDAGEEKIEEARLEYEKAIEQAKSYGAPDPEATEPVQKAKEIYDVIKDSGTSEGEIYEHLYRFFERYYDNADFMSRRYFARETGSKAASYAVPYDGREVYLHWANRDQYYIKTSEYLTNVTFDIAKNDTAKDLTKEERVLFNMPESLKLHCRIIEATEGEHNNNKTTDKTERFFLIYADKPAVMEGGELVLQFEYRPDNEKSGTATKWQEKRIDEAESVILHALTGIGEAESYNQALRTEIGDGKNRRTLLRKYLNRYTKRNTSDYFIHKDLGNFLKRELDFYIKNEIMRLDDIEFADAPHVQTYLDKIKVLRKIAGQLITFLTQLEEFQKKLWLKKKFVTETQYCITLDRIPEHFYAEVAANDAQRIEWVILFAIDELDGYSEPLTVDFLNANLFLMLDTAFFPESLKNTLLASIQDLDENLNGLLISSENFQALELMQEKYKRNIKCVHIDPPYNTDTSGFLYKNNYSHSSWLTMMHNRLNSSVNLLNSSGMYQCHIDENEYERLHLLIETSGLYSSGTVIWDKKNPMLGRKGISTQHEYVHISSMTDASIYRKNTTIRSMLSKADELIKKEGEINEKSCSEFAKWVSSNKNLSGGEKAYKYIDEEGCVYRLASLSAGTPSNDSRYYIPLIHPVTQKECPVPPTGWSRPPETFKKLISRGIIVFGADHKTLPQIKLFMTEDTKRQLSSVISSAARGKFDAQALGYNFPYCHPVSLYEELLGAGLPDPHDITLDYFAGSGTTGHAVVNLNREDGGQRKYIMVEMGNYVDAVTMSRMKKVVYSKDWKDGKPVSRKGISHAFKYIRLESYEDTLNNLSFKDVAVRDQALQTNPNFRRDYMLKYWLDFETKNSPSLLNIDRFDDPTNYMLKLKKPSSDEYEEKIVDVIETFNWLIGLHVDHLDQWRNYSGNFTREPDPELPDDDTTRLIIDGWTEESDDGKWLFRKVEGRVCRSPGDMNNTDRVLVIWRKLTGNFEEDNLMLDEWFKQYCLSSKDTKFDVIYVNGSNNLLNLRQDDEHWQVRLIEESFHQKMWDMDA